MQPTLFAPTDRLSRHYAQRIRQIISRFNDVRELIQHEGMKGTRVEKEVRQFLLDFLPERYQYSSGIVIDNSGDECDRSRQEDILIIDRFFNPKLFLDEEPSIYPVEVVYCGVEVKTSVDSSGLKKAIENIVSLKKLKYIQEPIVVTRGNITKSILTTGPRGIIFAFDTSIKSAETLLNHVASSLEHTERKYWPDLICILNRGTITIGEDNKLEFKLFGLLGKDDTGQPGEIEILAPSVEAIVEGKSYPVVSMGGIYYVVDVARTFSCFLLDLYEFLLNKIMMTNSNLLRHYLPREMTRYQFKFYQKN